MKSTLLTIPRGILIFPQKPHNTHSKRPIKIHVYIKKTEFSILKGALSILKKPTETKNKTKKTSHRRKKMENTTPKKKLFFILIFQIQTPTKQGRRMEKKIAEMNEWQIWIDMNSNGTKTCLDIFCSSPLHVYDEKNFSKKSKKCDWNKHKCRSQKQENSTKV